MVQTLQYFLYFQHLAGITLRWTQCQALV